MKAHLFSGWDLVHKHQKLATLEFFIHVSLESLEVNRLDANAIVVECVLFFASISQQYAKKSEGSEGFSEGTSAL